MSNLMNTMQSTLGKLGSTITNGSHKILSPETRADIAYKLKTFAINNPKLAAFMTAQIALTGLPLVLFVTFCITVFLFSLIAALLVGLVVALLFTVFMVAIALVVVLPTIFLTTFGATFLFFFGIGGYYALKWVNGGESPTAEGTAVGDKINSLTGGRMKWLTTGIQKKQEDAAEGAKEAREAPKNEKDESASATGAETSKKNLSDNDSTGARKPPKLKSASKDSATKHTEIVNGSENAQKVSESTKGSENVAEPASGAT
ncbi:hypothetical protein DM02DRAFT_608661 [Periconia macrospinosa]|uniref:Uncharacterized protein n=1 Tax=Periconia macrospinosa TaxID=97972 RepID=A0A2V1EBS2_9PLEO|nr:hypothetical protein DM02DRAFT_608661 [Periconia macrospinosa]